MMGVLNYLWKSTRAELMAFGKASRPLQPGEARKKTTEEQRQTSLAYLDRNGPAQMSEQGWLRVQELLIAAQDRPAGSKK